MDIDHLLHSARIQFLARHDGRMPRCARVPSLLAAEMTEQLQARGNHFPLHGQQLMGLTLIEDANVSELTLE